MNAYAMNGKESEHSEHSENSELLDRRVWADNPSFLMSIPPRISKYKQRADDAIIQFHIDAVGKDNIGAVDGGMTPYGSFNALIYPECLPDRIAPLAYLTETVFFWDDVSLPEPDEVVMKESESNAREEVDFFQRADIKGRLKQAFSKVVAILNEIDPVLGPEVLETWKAWRLAETNVQSNFEEYRSLDEYVKDRIDDVGYPCIIAMGKFACKLSISPEEEAIADQIAWPLRAHGIFSNDYFSWSKELKAHEKSGGKIPIINAVMLLMRFEGLSAEEARARLREKCFELDAEYRRRKEKYIQDNAHVGVSPAVVKFLDCYEQYATGHAIWPMTSFRHNAPGGDGYRGYYQKRLQEGVMFFDDCTQSKHLLTGQHEVQYKKTSDFKANDVLGFGGVSVVEVS